MLKTEILNTDELAIKVIKQRLWY